MFVRFDDINVIHHEGYQVIPLECDVCRSMMKKSDIQSYKKYGCCEHCGLMHAQPNSKKWSEGWRPSRREIDRVLKIKQKQPIYIMRGL